MRPLVALAAGALLLGAPDAARAQTLSEAAADTVAVIEAARSLLDAISARDTALARAVSTPDMQMRSTAPAGAPTQDAPAMSLDEFLDILTRPGPAFVERMWDPQVRIRGRIADVWTPYDFWADGELSHCGVDAFQLVRTEDGWRVASVVWTIEQPPACEEHPDGPPEP